MAKISLMCEEPFLSINNPQHRGGRIFLYYAAQNTDSFVITSYYKDRPNKETIDGTSVYRIFSFKDSPFLRIINSLKLLFKSFFIIRRKSPDIIFAKTSGCYLPALVISRLTGAKCKIHVGSFPKYKGIKTFLLRLPYDEIVTVGEHLKEEIQSFSSAPVRMVRNGIDLSLFEHMDREKARERLKLPSGFIILYVGGFEPVKRLPFLVEIFKNFQQKHQDSRLVLVGDGSQKEKIKNLVDKQGLKGKVIFRDPIAHTKVKLYYNAANLLVLTSSSEGGSPPRTVLEALACNTPAISPTQSDEKFLKRLGVRTAKTKEEYLKNLEEVYRNKEEPHLENKLKSFTIENQIKSIFKPETI